jgi:hypothetical protein
MTTHLRSLARWLHDSTYVRSKGARVPPGLSSDCAAARRIPVAKQTSNASFKVRVRWNVHPGGGGHGWRAGGQCLVAGLLRDHQVYLQQCGCMWYPLMLSVPTSEAATHAEGVNTDAFCRDTSSLNTGAHCNNYYYGILKDCGAINGYKPVQTRGEAQQAPTRLTPVPVHRKEPEQRFSSPSPKHGELRNCLTLSTKGPKSPPTEGRRPSSRDVATRGSHSPAATPNPSKSPQRSRPRSISSPLNLINEVRGGGRLRNPF